MFNLRWRKPLYTTIREYFMLPTAFSLNKRLTTLCRSSLMRSVQSFELDDRCMLVESLGDDELRFDQVIRLTHIRISFFDFNQCIHLLNQLGSQLHSFTVNIEYISEYDRDLISKIRLVSKISRFDISMNLFI